VLYTTHMNRRPTLAIQASAEKHSPTESEVSGLSSFIASTPKRKQRRAQGSRLDAHSNEIAVLTSQGYSLTRIQEFLKTAGVEVSRATVHNFIKRQLQQASK